VLACRISVAELHVGLEEHGLAVDLQLEASLGVERLPPPGFASPGSGTKP
jgi:hypothetical protein